MSIFYSGEICYHFPMKTTQQEQNKTENHKILYRSSNKMLAGVAAGIAEYFAVDPSIIRLIFVLLTVFGGSGILIYIILWIMLPPDSSKAREGKDMMKENVQEMKEKVTEFAKGFKLHPTEKKERSQFGFGIVIVIIGVLFLLNNMGLFEMVEVQKFWPLLLIFLGIYIVSRNE